MIFWGWGVMNQTALKAAQKVGFPRDRMIGSLVGRFGGGYRTGGSRQGLSSATFNVAGKAVPLSLKSKKWFTGGRATFPIRARWHRTLQSGSRQRDSLGGSDPQGARKYGKRQSHDGRAGPLGMENLNITDARLKALGATGLLPEVRTSCANHEGREK